MDVRIDMDRGDGWMTRCGGTTYVSLDALLMEFPHYAIQYPHRLYVDGVMIAEVVKPRGAKSKVIRHDAA